MTDSANDKKLLLTGAAGFLGRHIARHFASAGWQVLGVDVVAPENALKGPGIEYAQLDLPSAELADLLKEQQPTACVHCAGRASVPMSLKDPAADFQANTVLVFEILEALRRHAPRCRFVLLSSAAVYGNPERLPVRESDAIAPLSPYGFHKRQAELLLEEFARVYGLPTVVTRIFSAYGPGLRRQVVWDICERILTQGVLTLSGTGQESRDFIHAADIAEGLAVVTGKAPANGEAYNLSTGRETTIAELAALLASFLGKNTAAVFDGKSRIGDPINWRSDIGRMSALGFAPRMSLEAGLAQTAAWTRAELGFPDAR
jgi:UDP-glucose 4-epimerase